MGYTMSERDLEVPKKLVPFSRNPRRHFLVLISSTAKLDDNLERVLIKHKRWTSKNKNHVDHFSISHHGP